ncbi:hypothetical protein HOP50_02g16260 [Chloropicon primus]|uniref:Zinc finger LSD1-type domain-containing protein n=1 Tax=Chloropicon primus TaxID=1764295 RepID=A0A5B8MF74_9CHLO|nr:hypothetical protein A3770_02p16310 [Chloropicon primus]UPQ98321.1 hypothetical protein HOP50_02g16260 [Chloropicon primus]|mmetsp:Transcript_9435/g.26840  ORF Transcript_9435/g.26840 Transcript_9435/m.26840 type:complete len:202 (+) Transcript_9435:107-712(+)|eukprot:QDZ19113.1 hypothetical protein A3770_02p16310 [Chloropicon primus]
MSTQTREVVCIGCSTLLRFPAGAQVVRCVLCSQITPVIPQQHQQHQQPRQGGGQQQPQGASTSHLICGGCRTVLAYPTGAASVRCAVCTTVNQLTPQNTMANCRCQGCNTHLMYQPGATSVRCALCQHVTQVGGAVDPRAVEPRSGGEPAEAALSRQNSNTLYVIQNPSEEGEERYNMAIGVKVVESEGGGGGGKEVERRR